MSSESEPARLLRGELPSYGGWQVLVTVWQDGTAEAAVRPYEKAAWSPPVPLVDWPTK